MIVLTATGQSIVRLAFTPDGGIVAVGQIGVYWWATLTDTARPHRIPMSRPCGLALADGGRGLVVGLSRFGVRHFDLSDGADWLIALANSCQVAVSPVAPLVAGHSGYTGLTSCWRLTEDRTAEPLWNTEIEYLSSATGPVFSPDGAWVVCPRIIPRERDRCAVVIRNPLTGEILLTVPVTKPPTTPLAMHPTGQAVAYGSGHQLVAVPLLPAGSHPRNITAGTRKSFTDVAYHPSGRYLAASSNDATVKLYDTTTWTVAKTFAWNIGKLQSVAFSPDGLLAAAGSDTGKVVVWDVDV